MEWFLAAVFLVGAVTGAYRVGRINGFNLGRQAGWDNGVRLRVLQSKLPNGQPLTIQTFEDHAALTVTSNLYGTPDWFHHLCFKYAGENGEFHEHVGKASRDDGWSIFHGVKAMSADRKLALKKELGDELWYIVMLAKELDSSLEEVMALNIEKRESRRQRNKIHGDGDNR